MYGKRLTGHLAVRYFLVSLTALGLFSWLAARATGWPTLHESIWALLAALATACLVAGAVGWWLARRTSRQVHALVGGAEMLGSGARMPKLELPEIEEL